MAATITCNRCPFTVTADDVGVAIAADLAHEAAVHATEDTGQGAES